MRANTFPIESPAFTGTNDGAITSHSTPSQNIEHLQPFPFDQGAFIALLLAIAVPILPVILTEIPFAEVVKGLLSAVR